MLRKAALIVAVVSLLTAGAATAKPSPLPTGSCSFVPTTFLVGDVWRATAQSVVIDPVTGQTNTDGLKFVVRVVDPSNHLVWKTTLPTGFRATMFADTATEAGTWTFEITAKPVSGGSFYVWATCTGTATTA